MKNLGWKHKRGGATAKQQEKVGKVMREFKKGELHVGKSDKVVKDPKQAIAIALSEANLSKKAKGGGVGELTFSKLKKGDLLKRKGRSIVLEVVEVGKDYVKLYNDVTDTTTSFVNLSEFELVNKMAKGGGVESKLTNKIRNEVNEFLNPLGYSAIVDDEFSNGEIHIQPSTKKVGNNRSDFFDGMQIIRFSDGTYEVSEYQAGENEDELYIYKETKSLKNALKDLIKGNKRKPIKKYKKGGAISVGNNVRINSTGETMKVKSISKNEKGYVEFSGDKGSFLIGDIEKMATGGGVKAVEHFRLRGLSFLKDDLMELKDAIQEKNQEGIDKFFSYWGQHLDKLRTTNNERMFNFLKDDLGKLENAIQENDQAEIEMFFSYWEIHLESLKYAKGGEVGSDFYALTSDGMGNKKRQKINTVTYWKNRENSHEPTLENIKEFLSQVPSDESIAIYTYSDEKNFGELHSAYTPLYIYGAKSVDGIVDGNGNVIWNQYEGSKYVMNPSNYMAEGGGIYGIEKYLSKNLIQFISSLNEEQLVNMKKELISEINRSEKYDTNFKGSNREFALKKELDLINYRLGNKMEGGGSLDLNDYDMPVIRTQFEEEEFEFENGGGIYSRTKTTPDGKIVGKVEYNDFWKTYQVVIDGVVYEEFKTKEEAIDNLKNAGFDKMAKGGEVGSIDKLNRLGIKNTKEFGDKFRDFLDRLEENNDGKYIGYKLDLGNDELIYIQEKGIKIISIFDYSEFPKKGTWRLDKDSTLNYEDGGSLDLNDYDMPVIRTQFEEEDFEFAKGGSLDNENSYMVANNNKQIAHHTKELAEALKNKKNVPAWVVAKVNRAATDLSDATHYLEGEEKMYAKGGNSKKSEKPMTIKEFVLSQKKQGINEWIETIEKNGLTQYQDTIIEAADYFDRITINHNASFEKAIKFAEGGMMADRVEVTNEERKESLKNYPKLKF